MAVSSSTVTNFISPGRADLTKEGIHETHATPRYAVGTTMTKSNGNIYRYAHFGADTTGGKLVAQDFSESGVADTDNAIIAPASAQTTTDGTIGSKYIEMTVASVTANQFAGGTIHMTDDTGEGYYYPIVGNTATGDPASGNIRIQLAEPLVVAVDATTDAAIIGNLYSNLEASTAATDAIIAGVCMGNVDVSEAAYGWVQVSGVCSILADGAVTLGATVTLSDGVAGAVQVQDAYTEPVVGFCLDAADTTGYAPIRIILG